MASLDALIEAAKFVECKKGGGLQDTNALDNSPVSSSQEIDGERALVSFRRRPGGAGTRETHNKLEKFRRAHLKECFEKLRQHVPTLGSRKASNLSILKEALKYIEFLKEKDRKFESQRDKLMKCHKCLVERIKMFEEDGKRDGAKQQTAIGHGYCASDPVILALKQDKSQPNHSGVLVCLLTKRGSSSEQEQTHSDMQPQAEEQVNVIA